MNGRRLECRILRHWCHQHLSSCNVATLLLLLLLPLCSCADFLTMKTLTRGFFSGHQSCFGQFNGHNEKKLGMNNRTIRTKKSEVGNLDKEKEGGTFGTTVFVKYVLGWGRKCMCRGQLGALYF